MISYCATRDLRPEKTQYDHWLQKQNETRPSREWTHEHLDFLLDGNPVARTYSSYVKTEVTDRT